MKPIPFRVQMWLKFVEINFPNKTFILERKIGERTQFFYGQFLTKIELTPSIYLHSQPVKFSRTYGGMIFFHHLTGITEKRVEARILTKENYNTLNKP